MEMYEILHRVRHNQNITLMMLESISSINVNENYDKERKGNILHTGSINDVYILKKLIDKGLNIYALNDENQNALFYQEDIEVIKLLINKKLSVNNKDMYGNTPLIYSVNNIDKIKILIESGADINAKDNSGSNIAFYVQDKETLLYLIKKGLDVSIKNSYGETPLFNREIFDNPSLFQCFLDNGVDINAISTLSSINAVMKNINDMASNHLKILKLAKQAGLNLYHEDMYKQTLFNKLESSTSFRTLFEEGELNLNKLTKSGKSLFEDIPFNFIIKDLYFSGHLDMIELFNSPINNSVGDFLIKIFQDSHMYESKKLQSLKEKIIVDSCLQKKIINMNLNNKRL